MSAYHFLIIAPLLILAFSTWLKHEDFCSKPYSMPPPPHLMGALEPSAVVGERLYEGISGPECIAYENGAIYTCLINGACVKLVNGKIKKIVRQTNSSFCDGTLKSFARCGRPMALRRKNETHFLVLDGMLGVFMIDFENEKTEMVFSVKTPVDKISQKFPEDFDFIDDDTIIYSDASTKYSMDQFMIPFIEACGDGRLIKLTLSTGKAETLTSGFSFANGVQAHPDGQSVLVAESSTAQIHRYYFSGPKMGLREVFAENLPGLPDNIRMSTDRKSFYVALFALRFHGNPYFLDYMAPRSWLRMILAKTIMYLPEAIVFRILNHSSSTYGMFVELDLNGIIINSYHDPEGKIILTASTIVDDGADYLYLGSHSNKYVGRILKHKRVNVVH